MLRRPIETTPVRNTYLTLSIRRRLIRQYPRDGSRFANRGVWPFPLLDVTQPTSISDPHYCVRLFLAI